MINKESENIDFDNWVMPDLEREAGEIERTASSLGIDKADILQAIEHGHPEDLTDELWSRLENTDSWEIKQIEEAKQYADLYQRDVKNLQKGFLSNLPVFMPIILIRKDGTPYKIAGNTRLMISRAFGIIPKVFIARL